MSFAVGLTGGIATGKSTVAGLFQELGVTVLDADAIVRELITQDEDIISSIVEHFGAQYRNADGSLDRKALRARIFSDARDKTFLEVLLHPRVRDALINGKQQMTSPYGILVIPLLIEADMQDLVNRILVIDMPMELQIQRIMQRDHIGEQQARQAIGNQIPADERLLHADDVIDNSLTKEELRQRVAELHQQYLELARAY